MFYNRFYGVVIAKCKQKWDCTLIFDCLLRFHGSNIRNKQDNTMLLLLQQDVFFLRCETDGSGVLHRRMRILSC